MISKVEPKNESFFVFLVALVFEYLLGKHSTTWATHSANSFLCWVF
jgi:hypothetical protein